MWNLKKPNSWKQRVEWWGTGETSVKGTNFQLEDKSSKNKLKKKEDESSGDVMHSTAMIANRQFYIIYLKAAKRVDIEYKKETVVMWSDGDEWLWW